MEGTWFKAFSDLALQVTQHHLHHILLIASQSLVPVQTHGEGKAPPPLAGEGQGHPAEDSGGGEGLWLQSAWEIKSYTPGN